MIIEMSFQLISNIFSDFSFERDQRMDGRTDRACFRGAMAHLGIILLLGKKSKNVFRFLSSGLGINVSLFHLRPFKKVESELGSPLAGVEISTG